MAVVTARSRDKVIAQKRIIEPDGLLRISSELHLCLPFEVYVCRVREIGNDRKIVISLQRCNAVAFVENPIRMVLLIPGQGVRALCPVSVKRVDEARIPDFEVES